MELADARKFFRVKARATNERPIHIALAHDVDDIG
jgi:hypothetical protein